ncbi:U-box domain-containing protein 13 [Datura stramonium]|uniref:RING-type E3 ubiquitin transferase n=1 Tax=Datura stramonium TaxID=4076 RepID=A0ABS8SGU1_DATST|nr:U-box domain-containing protein 13 [Datura stramonium]
MEEERGVLAQKLTEVVNEISAISDFRVSVKKEYCNLARRLKLLIPMFEEIRDSKESIPEDSMKALVSLKEALESTKKLLKFGSEGSKIYLVLEREQIMNKFHGVTTQLEQALGGVHYEELDISDEVKEQVELVLSQFQRAKGRVDTPDAELHEDLLSLYSKNNDAAIDPAVLRKLVEKLQLTEIYDLTQESCALHEMVTATGEDPEERIEKMSVILRKIKDFVLTEIPEIDSSLRDMSSTCSGEASAEATHKAPVIPDDFRCPISLELMKDPVIVSSGQTYERSSIEKWLEAGHGTCPKTQQVLISNAVTPNYVLRSLIAQWCEANGVEPPKRPGSLPNKSASVCTPAERSKIENLLRKLTSGSPEDRLSATGEIRLLAKRNADNRVAIAEAGAIPLLVDLLSTPDSRIQEHAVTALLNLSICEDNKRSIVTSGAVPGIVHVLKKGSTEARENAAAALFSLSVIDENKVIIGTYGAIPPLVTLLSDGTQRGKKDAATALFNLCIYQGNKGKAVRAGVVLTLMELLTEPQGGMIDEALAILAILSSHPDGKTTIGAAGAVPVLVNVITNGSPRNKENAAAVLVHLCSGDQHHILEVQELGVTGPLLDLIQNGTERGRRKATQLLERINRYAEQQKQAQTESEAPVHAQTHNQLSQSPPSSTNALDN